ncbi:MAG: hypothetical protein LBQ30_04245 [Treponema sp.]|nr:hypothetical protein [Treponema sp.]
MVCGGTTSLLAAAFLCKPLNTILPRHLDPAIPPVAKIDGVDLVTEGLITIRQVLEYARKYLAGTDDGVPWYTGEDGASQIARMLFDEAGEITLYVGKAVNPAHQDAVPEEAPAEYGDKIGLLRELESCLKKMGKPVQVHYC